MKHQFYIVINPKVPADPRYIFHAKPPRFFAKITGEQLELDEIIDDAPIEKIESKLKRMQDWYRDYLLNKIKYDRS